MDVDDEGTAAIDAQIAALQAAKAKKLAKAAEAKRVEEEEAARILVGSTPVKSKAKRELSLSPGRPTPPVFTSTKLAPRPPSAKPRQVLPSVPLRPPPSNMSSALATLRNSSSVQTTTSIPVPRSSGFTDRPSSSTSKPVGQSELEVQPQEIKSMNRDEDSLTVIESLVLGPKKVGKDPEGEDEWRNVEPNSGIRLSKRVLSHQAVQDHLFGRYFLSPSQLYSVIRLSKDGATYEVPVEGDWLTIAVVAERSDVRVSGAKQEVVSDIDDSEDEEKVRKSSVKHQDKSTKDKGKGKDESLDEWKKRRGPRKYINLKLCSLPPRTRGSSSKGDALLQLLLFQSDHVVKQDVEDVDGEGPTTKRSYRGGSGGAYEKFCNLAVGSVIAILNPRVLRPLRGGAEAPHPLTLPLALNPTSEECISLIGQASDLGCCTAIQKNGNRCGNWVDIRESQVCEYHVFAAIQRGRSKRSEFTASTSVFALATSGGAPIKRNTAMFPGSFQTGGSKSSYDPRRKTGLIPAGGPQAAPRTIDNGGGGATYIVGGGVVRTSKETSIVPGFTEGARSGTRKKRRIEEKELDEALKRILERDGPSGSVGAQYLHDIEQQKKEAKAKDNIMGKTKTAIVTQPKVDDKRRPFSALTLRQIGFDPTNKTGIPINDGTVSKVDTSSLLSDHADRPVKLGRPPGPKVRNVMVPVGQDCTKPRPAGGEMMIDLDDF